MRRYINADLTDTEILNLVQEETADADTFITVRRVLNKLPTADVAPVVHASWVGTDFDGYADGYPVYNVFECSNCKEEHYGEEDTLTEYCPHCGAKMDNV